MRTPSVRSLLAASLPNAPYARQPHAHELVEALRQVVDGGMGYAAAMELVQRWDAFAAWQKRENALRSCILSHDLKATPAGDKNLRTCHCATCGRWRVELRALYADKADKEAVR
jgi:hypothetical protein